MNSTLVLNRSYFGIHIIPWQKSVSLVYQGAAEAVDSNLQCYNFEDWCELSALMEKHDHGFVHTINMKVAIPEVIRLTKYNQLPRQEVRFTRHNLYSHYRNKCCYCGGQFSTKELNPDHVIPRSKGGLTNWENIVTSCYGCNTLKDDRTPEQAGMKLLVKPSRPKWQGVRTILKQAPLPIPVSWSRLIDEKYWQTELEQG